LPSATHTRPGGADSFSLSHRLPELPNSSKAPFAGGIKTSNITFNSDCTSEPSTRLYCRALSERESQRSN
jgi:hypothetical protein